MSILSDYKVQFFNRSSSGKQISTINTWLSAYISDYYYVDAINRLLNGNINRVLSGEILNGGGQTQSLYFADITIHETRIYKDMELWENDNNITPDFVLPTLHLKVIIEAWKKYLQE